MSNQIFHFSNTGISSGQRFYLKDDVSGIFVRNLNIDSNFPVVASNLVYNTGDQIISGNKNFAQNVIVGDQTQDNFLVISGNKIIFGIYPTVNDTGIVYDQGNQIISGVKTFDVFPVVSGNKLITGLDLNSYATNANLFATGSTLDNKINSLSGYVNSQSTSGQVFNTGSILNNKINSLSGYVNSQDSIFSGQTFNTGSRLDSKINSLSGYVNSQDILFSGQTFNTGSRLDNKINALSGYVNSQDIVFSGQTFNTGSRLDNKINALSGYVNSQDIVFSDQTFNTGSRLDNKINALSGYVNSQDIVFSGQTFSTGSRLDNKINSLSGYVNSKSITLPNTIVYTTGNQIISGNKNFAQNVIVGDQTQDSLLIISGNKITFSVYPTVNGTGIVYNQGDQTISGIKTFASRPTVNGTGVLLSGEASAITLPTTIVYTTGDQLISGNKTFINNIAISGTGNFNAVKISSIDKLFLSGVDIVITGNSSINVYNAIYISGNPVLTGVLPTTQSLSNVVYTTGNQLISGNKTFLNNISVSGTGNFNNVKVSSIDKLFLSGIDMVVTGNSSINVYNAIYISGNPVATGFVQLNSYATLANLALTGSILDNKINSLSGYLSGQNSFVINLFNQAATQSAGHNYFGNLSMLFSSDLTQRRFPIFENCVARRASWSQINGTVGSPSLNSTGYFINTSTNPPQTGIISTVINTQSALTPTHYTADFSPPIMINKGDLVVCSLFGPPNYATFPATVRNSVNLYCYN